MNAWNFCCLKNFCWIYACRDGVNKWCYIIELARSNSRKNNLMSTPFFGLVFTFFSLKRSFIIKLKLKEGEEIWSIPVEFRVCFIIISVGTICFYRSWLSAPVRYYESVEFSSSVSKMTKVFVYSNFFDYRIPSIWL